MPLTWPEDFLWGTATSAHQIEGGNDANDWSEFPTPGGPAGRACDFVNRFEDDLDRARSLGTNAFRFSLEWSRVEPRPGERDEAAVAYYDRLVDACLARGLEPVLTLLHFTSPRWISRAGGWLAPATLDAFAKHARWVADRFAGRVRTWVTVNEPNVQAGAGYVSGVFAPGRRFRPDLAARCETALARAHEIAYRAVKERSPGSRVGPAPHLIAWRRTLWEPTGLVAREGRKFNWGFLDRLDPGTLDFVGLNYYMALAAHPIAAARFAGLIARPAGPGTSDMGWPIDANGFEEVLVAAHERYGRPLLVTENGIADANDLRRPKFIDEHVAAMERAMKRGADVRGYFHWSLIDNFEWHEGYAPRFGLFEVNYGTQERRERASADVYRRVIAARRVKVTT